MAGTVKPIPDGYEGVIPYLYIKDAGAAIDFYKKAFGATELFRLGGGSGPIGHAEIKIGGHLIMLADEFPDMGVRGPHTIGGTPLSIHMYVENVDAVAKRAIDAGIKVLRPVADQFYGDRMVQFEDPFGHRWSFATHVENVSHEEVNRRMAAMKECKPS